MSGGVLLVLWIVWAIVFLVLYHKVFTVYYFDLGQGIMKELIAAGFLGAIMAIVTVALWYIAAAVILLFGLSMKKKMDSNAPLVLAVAAAIIICIVGITLKSDTADGGEKSAKNVSVTYCADHPADMVQEL